MWHDGAWGTVCSDQWDDTDALVVCRSLGYGSGTALTDTHFGPGIGDVVLNNLQWQCDGSESDIFDCPRTEVGDQNCGHEDDAGVICSSAGETD